MAIQEKISELLGKKSLPVSFAKAVITASDLNDSSTEDAVIKAVDKFEALYRMHIQPEIDRRVDGGLKTWQEKHGIKIIDGKPVINKDDKKDDGQDPKKPETVKKEPVPDNSKVEIPSGLQALFEQQTKIIQSLSEEIKSIKKNNQVQTAREKASKMFSKFENLRKLQSSKPELADKWLNRLKVEDATDEELEEQLRDLDTEAKELFYLTRSEILGADDFYQPRNPKVRSEEEYLALMDSEPADDDPGVKKVEFPTK